MFMKREVKDFIALCKKSEEELKWYLKARLKDFGYEVVDEVGFLYAKGKGDEGEILVTAHMDTVHKEVCRKVYVNKKKGKTIIKSPQGIGGDDRCGVYIILRLLENGHRPSVLFCEEEEKGGIGSGFFCETKYIDEVAEMRFAIELDRANANDAVYYDDDNEEFKDAVYKATGYVEEWGSFSDISVVCPSAGISGVNLSCGYYKAHTVKEYVVFEEMENTIKATEKLLKVKEGFKYTPVIWDTSYGTGYNYYGYSKTYKDGCEVEFMYLTDEGKEGWYSCVGDSFTECVGQFLMDTDAKWSDVLDWYEY